MLAAHAFMSTFTHTQKRAMTHIKRTSLVLLVGLITAAAGVVYGDLLQELGRSTLPATIVRTGTIAYDAATGNLQVTGTPLRTLFESGPRQHAPAPPGLIRIDAQVLNAAGTEVQGVGSPHFQLEGALDVDGDGTIEADESGVMLTGTLVEIAKNNAAPGTADNDQVGFRFTPTGGFMASYYAGRNIGVEVQLANNGAWPPPPSAGADFANSFSGPITIATVKPIVCGTQIGDFVWHDQDHDGIQDPGEPGLNGIEVRLRNTAGNVVAQATTGRGPLNQGGYYMFERTTGICGGTYTVDVDLSTVPAGFVPTVRNASGANAGNDSNNPAGASVTLANDAAINHTIDFGFTTPFNGVVGGFAWHDSDGDGVQDAGEPGLENIGVNLYNATTDSLIGTTTTIAGRFGFNGLEPGDFRVELIQSTVPPGFEPTLENAGADELDSDGSPAFVTLAGANNIDLSIGFGFVAVCAGEVGDYIWYDRNQNGIQNPDEPGLAGVDVSLVAGDGTVVATATSGANGAYRFTGVCGGSYNVVVDAADLPAGFSPTVANSPSTDDSNDSDGSPAPVVLANDVAITNDVDLGFIAPCTGSIGDRMWNDADQDGIQDAGEEGFEGLTVNLRRLSDNTIIQTDITDADGRYLFTGLCPGSYLVEGIRPTGASVSLTNVGSDRSVDSDANPSVVTLELDNSSTLDIDFGSYCTGRIGDFVWHDANEDGLQNTGEAGIANAQVRLIDSRGRIQTTTTNASGAYLFTGLCGGQYRVELNTPAGFDRPTIEVPANPTLNSSTSPVQVTLTGADRLEPNVDFGFILKVVTPPPAEPGVKIVKSANKHTVVFGESVTYTYTVTNTGGVTLTDVLVVDDNATATYRRDDFTVGTVAVLKPGESVTFTKKLVPPAKLCNTDSHGNNRNCGVMLTHLIGAYVKFVYLQAKDHRNDYRTWDGWWGGRSYSHKAKFRVLDSGSLNSMDVNGDIEQGDDEEYENGFSVTVAKSYVGNDEWVNAPRVYHKKGWDADWRDDWDWKFGDLLRYLRWDDDRWDRDNDQDYDYGKHPKQCPTISTNVVKVTAKAGDKVISATDKETVNVVAPVVTSPYKTFTQGGWGAKPSGNNPGKFLSDKFKTVYPGGYVSVGGTKTIKLTSAYAVEKFLPQGGSPAKLTQNYVNPTSQISVFAGQVLALRLNVDFSARSLTRKGLGTLTVVSGELAGKTVNQVLSLANSVLGGGSLPYGLTLSELNDVVSKINENFDGGTQNNGYLRD
jgi:hypothetical protein